MMDLYCKFCAEPWDNDSLHDVAEERHVTYQTVRADFARRGCTALSGETFGPIAQCQNTEPERAELIGMIYELNGDDVDGAMSDLDDVIGMF